MATEVLIDQGQKLYAYLARGEALSFFAEWEVDGVPISTVGKTSHMQIRDTITDEVVIDVSNVASADGQLMHQVDGILITLTADAVARGNERTEGDLFLYPDDVMLFQLKLVVRGSTTHG